MAGRTDRGYDNIPAFSSKSAGIMTSLIKRFQCTKETAVSLQKLSPFEKKKWQQVYLFTLISEILHVFSANHVLLSKIKKVLQHIDSVVSIQYVWSECDRAKKAINNLITVFLRKSRYWRVLWWLYCDTHTATGLSARDIVYIIIASSYLQC